MTGTSHDGEARVRSTTRRQLHLLRAALLIGTVAALIGPLLAFQRVHETADTVRTNVVEALRQLAATEEDLVLADNAAIASFRSPQAQLSGPGIGYEHHISIASRRMAQVAELSIAGDAANQHIQVVQGLLVTYQGLIAQAHAHARAGGEDTLLAAAYLKNASDLLRGEILARLHDLQDEERRALDRELADGSSHPLVDVLWAIPVLLLLVLLLVTQVFLARRFRRTFSVLLVAATLVGLALAHQSWSATAAENDLRDARALLSRSLTTAREEAAAIGDTGRRDLDDLLRDHCSNCFGAGTDRDGGVVAEEAGVGSADADAPRAVAMAATEAEGAAEKGDVRLLVSLPILIAVLIWGALQPRVEEYRYRSR